MSETYPSYIPKPPIGGNLYLRPEVEAYIGSNDVARITSFLRHDGSFDGTVHHANGRNVTIAIEQPPNGLYDSIQISGGAYIPMGIEANTDAQHSVVIMDPAKPKEIYPPAQGDKQFTHSYFVVENGNLSQRSDLSPMGSYAQALANRKIAMTARAGKVDSPILVVPKVLGKYEFDDLPDGQGGNATSLLFAVPLGGERADSAIFTHLLDACMRRPDLLHEALDEYMPPIMQTLSLVGQAAADIHAEGLVHNQLTLGNVLAMQTTEGNDLIYVADWETATDMNPDDEKLTRIFDLVVAFRSFSGAIDTLKMRSDITTQHAVSILSEGLMVLLSGYNDVPEPVTIEFTKQRKQLWSDALIAMHAGTSDVASYTPVIELAGQLVQYR